MDKLERAYHLDKLLKQRRTPVSMQALRERFECSEATVKRVIYDMRLYLNAPIENSPGQGYFYSKGSTFEMPGVWFSAEELHALLTMQQLASGLSGGFLEAELNRLRQRIEAILQKSAPAAAGQMHRIRMIAAGKRSRELPLFPVI
ncbi:MAG: transcriptional regulator, partial [Zetaproteobacteria bacterium CG_4_8_14_3_um_filter_59_5]